MEDYKSSTNTGNEVSNQGKEESTAGSWYPSPPFTQQQAPIPLPEVEPVYSGQKVLEQLSIPLFNDPDPPTCHGSPKQLLSPISPELNTSEGSRSMAGDEDMPPSSSADFSDLQSDLGEAASWISPESSSMLAYDDMSTASPLMSSSPLALEEDYGDTMEFSSPRTPLMALPEMDSDMYDQDIEQSVFSDSESEDDEDEDELMEAFDDDETTVHSEDPVPELDPSMSPTLSSPGHSIRTVSDDYFYHQHHPRKQLSSLVPQVSEDPELTRLLNLQQAARLEEKKARLLENALSSPPASPVLTEYRHDNADQPPLSAEAVSAQDDSLDVPLSKNKSALHSARKRAKERCRELEALIRLGLQRKRVASPSQLSATPPTSPFVADKVDVDMVDQPPDRSPSHGSLGLTIPSPRPSSLKKGTKSPPSSLSQLVARMILKRRERGCGRPLRPPSPTPTRPTPFATWSAGSTTKKRSPLSCGWFSTNSSEENVSSLADAMDDDNDDDVFDSLSLTGFDS